MQRPGLAGPSGRSRTQQSRPTGGGAAPAHRAAPAAADPVVAATTPTVVSHSATPRTKMALAQLLANTQELLAQARNAAQTQRELLALSRNAAETLQLLVSRGCSGRAAGSTLGVVVLTCPGRLPPPL